ncbi:MAG TPA: xanthine dehydrogenase family protein molybdopterin-binding subunit [Thermoleophilaceae bacterium]|jgi:carbon-monoxide dehydrogenase large subunit|nr:xanthine dehydrogenase family protein molybdopterin-binding subunit [Thermoleophilaceae bacterium]
MRAPAAGLIGQPLVRREDERILLGQTTYLDDIELPGLAHAAFVRSPHAHARVTAVHVPADAPGLVAVISADDLGDRVQPFPVQAPPGMDTADEPHPVLASGEVRYVGQAVALVVAESRGLAEDVAELVEVDYEPLEPLTNPRRDGPWLTRWARSSGDVDGAFARAGHVVRVSHTIPRLVASPMETRGALAMFDPGSGLLTMWLSAQDPHRPLSQLAHALKRPQDTIRVIIPDVGGAFGSKGVVAPECAAVAIAAIDLARPVKWAEDRLENFLAAYQGRGVEVDVELALDADGRMLALRARIFADLGGYLVTTTAIPSHTTAMLMTGVYDVEAADVELVGLQTHRVPTGPYRGAGRPEAAYALELTVDAAARALGMDPIELRRMNLVSEFPHKTPLGFTYDSGDYERCLDRAVELADFATLDAGPGRLVGRGVGMYVERAGGQWESAHVTVEPDGRVIVRSGSNPHGQGHDTVFAQIAAERLGIEPNDVVLRFGDSAVVPRGVGTFASRSVAMGGSAIVLAIDEIRDKCVKIAAHLLEAEEDELAWTEGAMLRAGDGREVSLGDLAAAAYNSSRLPTGMEPGLEASARFSSEQVFSSGAYAAAVAIEQATGRLELLRLVAVDDAGVIVNPLLAEGQVIGGIAQGLGASLVEEVVYDEAGQLQTASYADYSLMTAAEMPHVATAFVVSPSPLNPLGAKGIGEGGAIGTPAAVGNAVANALGGRILDPPYTANKVWHAIQEETS